MTRLDRDMVLAALSVCRGRANGQSARTLVQALLYPEGSAADERRLRMIVEDLRMEGVPICSRPETGYYLAETPEEIEEAIAFLRSRAMTSLEQIARLQRVALPELLGQMQLEAHDGQA